MPSFDVSAFDEAELRVTLAEVRAAQRSLDGLVMRIGARANILASSGSAAAAEQTARAGGAVSARQARREAVRAATAQSIPAVGTAASAGQISGEHIDAIARHTTKLSESQRSQLDLQALVDKAKRLPVETFERLLRRETRRVATDHGLGDTKAKQAAAELRHWFDHDVGMGKIFACLDPELYERIAGAIDRQVSALASNAGETKDGNLAARALGELITHQAGGRPQVPSVTVLVDHLTFAAGPHADSVCQTESGHHIATESLQRMCCDAMVRRVVFDERGVPIDVGRKCRTAEDGQWAAIKAMYSNCAWDGCASPIGWCQAHHIHEWENGGRTDLNNLIPLCSTHHHRVHEGRWRMELAADRSLKLFRPDGALHVTVPTPMRC